MMHLISTVNFFLRVQNMMVFPTVIYLGLDGIFYLIRAYRMPGVMLGTGNKTGSNCLRQCWRLGRTCLTSILNSPHSCVISNVLLGVIVPPNPSLLEIVFILSHVLEAVILIRLQTT